MALSKDVREQFPGEPHIGALSVQAGALTAPIWNQYTPGNRPWVLIGAGSRKARLIEVPGCFSLNGRACRADDALGRRRRAGAGPNLGGRLAIFLSAQHWLPSDMGAF